MGIIVDIYKAYEKMEGKRKALPFVFKLLGLDSSTLDGGEGSGNFGHAGRPGKIGGSASEGESGASSGAAEREPSKWHKEQERRRGIVSKWSDERKAEHLFMLGFLSEEDAVEAMENGTIQQQVDLHFDIMEENGDPTPTKPLRKQVELYGEIKEGKHGGDWDQARIDYIKDWTGMNDEEAQTAFKELKQWVSFGGWDKADTSVVDDYIDRDGAYNGEIYRGMHFSEDEYAAFMEQIAVGNRIGMNGRNSSWSNDKESAWHFSKNGDRHVIIHCKKNKTAAPIDHIAGNGEKEVVANSKTLWTVIGVRVGDSRTEIDVIEAEDRMTDDEYERRRSMLDSALPEKQEGNKNEKTLGDRMNAQQKYFFVIPRKPRDTMSAADGGPGSGNWGHRGRPGKVGGSGKGAGRSAPNSKERDEQRVNVEKINENSVHFRIPVYMTRPEKFVEMLSDTYDIFSEMNDEELREFAEKQLPKPTVEPFAEAYYEREQEKHIAPEKILRNDDHFEMLVACTSLGNLNGDKILELANDKDRCRNTLKKILAEKIKEKYDEIPGLERFYDSDAERSKQYRNEIDHIKDVDKEAEKIWGKDTTSAQQYFELVEEGQKNISFEQYVAQYAYVNGGLGTTAQQLNEKMYKGGELTEAEKEMVDLLRSSAIETSTDMVHYRMLNSKALTDMFGSDGPKVGQSITIDAFSSCCCGAVAHGWEYDRVMIRFRTKAGHKVIAPYNPVEGESILLNGLTGKILSVKKGAGDFPVFFDDNKGPNNKWYVHVPNSTLHNSYVHPTEITVIDIEVTDDGSTLQNS